MTALQRRDEQGNIYDLTRVFFDELLRHPFALHDDLIALGAGRNTARISRDRHRRTAEGWPKA